CPVRGGVESQQHDHLSVLHDSVILSNMEDRWFWDLNGDSVFRVNDVRILLDEAFLPKMEVPTRWIKSIPIKVNVFAWKLFLDQEVDAFLTVEDEPTSSQFPQSYLDPEGDILLLEAFLNDDPSSDFKTKSSSTSLNSLLEETNTFDNSSPEFKTFCFDMEEISSGSTTTRSDISLPEYDAFYDDHVKEISSGSPTTHSDSSLYASFVFDLSINPFPPADRSDFYEFADELIHFISLPE
nr:RNA-directed DNA polymerase, eukaryota [Tanacetum cinerariifolium]